MSNEFFQNQDKDSFFQKLKNKADSLKPNQVNNNVIDQSIQDASANKFDASWISWPSKF